MIVWIVLKTFTNLNMFFKTKNSLLRQNDGAFAPKAGISVRYWPGQKNLNSAIAICTVGFISLRI
ncbi:hypothetical protein [Haliscomenobacter hydrossis]|uniref:hypothetical protein n=1 Tax=Haliscomenobacter hydrossis TaxID=2350 RepID=UPI000300D5FC|nr:hypothetical protein [Haliscomenobacter hydrossis]